MSLSDDLLQLAHAAPSRFGPAALEHLQSALEADVGVFATRRGPPVTSGLAPEIHARLVARFDRYAPDVAPVHAAAVAAGAATDLRTLGARWRDTRAYREIVAPSGGVESLFVVAALGGEKLGFVMLGRTRRRFTPTEIALAASLAPCLSVTCAALGARAPLGDTDEDLLGYLALGYSTRDIAVARGRSFYTVRNQLSALYRRLGVANRAEALGVVRA